MLCKSRVDVEYLEIIGIRLKTMHKSTTFTRAQYKTIHSLKSSGQGLARDDDVKEQQPVA